MSPSQTFALAAALLMAAPIPEAADGRVIWVGLCDATHPGTQLPIPLDRGGGAPAKACHAGCPMLPDRRSKR